MGKLHHSASAFAAICFFVIIGVLYVINTDAVINLTCAICGSLATYVVLALTTPDLLLLWLGRNKPRASNDSLEFDLYSPTLKLPEGTEAAAVESSEYFVPTSNTLEDVFVAQEDRLRVSALEVAADLVRQYISAIKSQPGTSLYANVNHPQLRDYSLQTLVAEILRARGWDLSGYGSAQYSLSPEYSSRPHTFSDHEIASIRSSASLQRVLNDLIILPRAQKALEYSAQLVALYQKEASSGNKTSTHITLELTEKIDYMIFSDVRVILVKRGWNVQHFSGSQYFMSPCTPRDQPINGGLII
ncbi:MAG: hypothetical protein IAF58_02455 [Leptolyngbya sp.]|nr:hypothetical protein [Candidatus Melainabacteria bacterium]